MDIDLQLFSWITQPILPLFEGISHFATRLFIILSRRLPEHHEESVGGDGARGQRGDHQVDPLGQAGDDAGRVAVVPRGQLHQPDDGQGHRDGAHDEVADGLREREKMEKCFIGRAEVVLSF